MRGGGERLHSFERECLPQRGVLPAAGRPHRVRALGSHITQPVVVAPRSIPDVASPTHMYLLWKRHARERYNDMCKKQTAGRGSGASTASGSGASIASGSGGESMCRGVQLRRRAARMRWGGAPVNPAQRRPVVDILPRPLRAVGSISSPSGRQDTKTPQAGGGDGSCAMRALCPGRAACLEASERGGAGYAANWEPRR